MGLRVKRKIFFAAVFTLGLLCVMEVASLMIERVRPVMDPDANSPMGFQELADPYIEPWDYKGKDYFRTINLNSICQFFEKQKPQGQIRIALLGASQAGFMGYTDSASYGRHLERLLRVQHPQKDIRVINLARTGFASGQIAEVTRRVFPQVRPDLVLAVFGNNEKMDVRALQSYGQVPPRLYILSTALCRKSALARLVSSLIYRQDEENLAGQNPIPMGRLSPEWERFWQGRLARSLSRIADQVDEVGAKFVVCRPPSNAMFYSGACWWWAYQGHSELQSPPLDLMLIKARHWMRYGPADKAVDQLVQFEQSCPGPASQVLLGMAYLKMGDVKKASFHYEKALAVLPDKPDISQPAQTILRIKAHVGIGQEKAARKIAIEFLGKLAGIADKELIGGIALYEAGLTDQAREKIIGAADDDWQGIHADGKVAAVLKGTSEKLGMPYYDLDRTLARTTPAGISGWDLFADYCHFSPEGHIRMAGILLPIVEKNLGLPVTQSDPAGEVEAKMVRDLHGREKDFPQYNRWLGADQCIWAITDEYKAERRFCDDKPDKTDPDSWCFLGNHAFEKDVGTQGISQAILYYEKAMELVPGYQPAAENIAELKKRIRTK